MGNDALETCPACGNQTSLRQGWRECTCGWSERGEAQPDPLPEGFPRDLPPGTKIVVHFPPMPESELFDLLRKQLMEANKIIAAQARRLAEVEATVECLEDNAKGWQHTLCVTEKEKKHYRARAKSAEARLKEVEAERDALRQALTEEQHAHKQTIRVMADSMRRMKAENNMLANSYKLAHDEVITLRRQLNFMEEQF